MEVKKLKRTVIKEELVVLTGDIKLAIVLNQMIYWSERVKDFDNFIKEECVRFESFGDKDQGSFELELQNGWIYKKADELSSETMLNVKSKAMLGYLDKLVENGWIDKRRNPRYNFDKTYQYRVNIIKIVQDLHKLGYSLDGYSIDLSFIQETSSFPKENTEFLEENPIGEKESSNVQKENSNVEKENPNVEKERAIPEITNRDYIQRLQNRDYDDYKEGESSSVGHAIQFFTQNFEKPSTFLQQSIKTWCETLNTELVIEAMKIALLNNKSFAYAQGVLIKWQEKGYKTLEEFKAGEQAFQESKAKRTASKGTSLRTEMTPEWLNQETTNNVEVAAEPEDEERFKELISRFA